MAMLQPTRKTVADYLAYDEERVELIDGEFLVTASPSFRHQDVIANLHSILRPQIRLLGLGKVCLSPLDTILSTYDVVQPDLLFLSTESLKRVKIRIEGPPDVAIEVLSPSDRKRDLVTKRRLYFDRGVQEYWIVDPEATAVTVLVRSSAGWREHGIFKRGDSVTSEVMKGVIAPVSEIFE